MNSTSSLTASLSPSLRAEIAARRTSFLDSQHWLKRVVVIIGAGPSLTAEDCETVRSSDAVTVALNSVSRTFVPWCDHLHACDVRWWEWHPEMVRHPATKTIVWPVRMNRDKYDVLEERGLIILRETGTEGYDPVLGNVRTGRNSGYQAIHLALQLGASKIVLLGMDMGVKDINGPVRCHGHHPGQNTRPNYEGFAKHFADLKQTADEMSREVVNASRWSTIECFPKVRLEDAL